MVIRLPPSRGVGASTLQLPPGSWTTVFECLCAHFAAIGRDAWRDRIARGRVLDAQGAPITEMTPYRLGSCIHYYREVADEPCIPFAEAIIHIDEHLIVADKPHFLPVTPAGAHVAETLLARLIRRFDKADLAPLHRIDRATAGLVLFSVSPTTRAHYQALFRDRRIVKQYEALAPALPLQEFPHTRKTRLVRAEPFFRMQEVAGVPNAETRIDVLQREGNIWRYALAPLTGKKHQLRVHMAALGAPIVNDDFYPALTPSGVHGHCDVDYSRPLKLLAKSLAFIDPLNGLPRHFESRIAL
jgi:tRNA pseudouridine32 synthase/23S rRNA pseudouridine746 synthase